MTETAIADPELIGEPQTAAQVTSDGSIGWSCLPGFDPSGIVTALLDAAPDRPTAAAALEVRHG
jgi:GH15 family glucan-1,4-alpha-glucosidase